MKEIIYLNTDLMNSMLAQLDEGVINNFSFEQDMQQTESEIHEKQYGAKAGLSGGIELNTGALPGPKFKLDSSFGGDGSEREGTGRTILEGQKDILNKAFHDYSLNILTQKLKENDLLQLQDAYDEGDIFLAESQFSFYDFGLISRSSNYSQMRDVMLMSTEIDLGMKYNDAKKLVAKRNPTTEQRKLLKKAREVVSSYDTMEHIINVMEHLKSLSLFASNLLEGLVLIKAGNKAGLLKKEYLRESSEALSFRTTKTRKAKFLVRVIGKKDIVYNGDNFPDMATQDLDSIPNIMLDVILGSFSIIEEGDLMVQPIAIYYE